MPFDRNIIGNKDVKCLECDYLLVKLTLVYLPELSWEKISNIPMFSGGPEVGGNGRETFFTEHVSVRASCTVFQQLRETFKSRGAFSWLITYFRKFVFCQNYQNTKDRL